MQTSAYTKSSALLLSITTSWFAMAPPVEAQVWGYSPYTGNASWLGLARTLSYPLNRLSSRGMPLYLANNLIYSASYATNKRLTGRQRDYYYGTYADQDPQSDPRQRTRPLIGSPSVGDQMVHAKRYATNGSENEPFEDVPVATNAQQPQDWLVEPAPIVAAAAQNDSAPFVPAPNTVARAHSDVMPPVAPQHAKPSAGEPLVEGFIHVLNNRFAGDIGDALADKDTCKYARAVGLIDTDKPSLRSLSREKKDLIRAILADDKESASVRINAVRVLLKH